MRRARHAHFRTGRAWLPAAPIAIAAAVAGLAALWIARARAPERTREPAHVAAAPAAAVASATPAAEPGEFARDASAAASFRERRLADEHRAHFRAVSDALLQLDPSLAPGHPPELDASGFGARVWTIPDPVESGAAYRIGIEASCACTALLFSVSEASGEIALLFPNPYQPNSRLEPNRSIELPSTPEWSLRAEGDGIDVLKLVLLAEPIAFPSDRSRTWLASADRPDRIAELEALLAAIEPGSGAAATAPLRIVARAARE